MPPRLAGRADFAEKPAFRLAHRWLEQLLEPVATNGLAPSDLTMSTEPAVANGVRFRKLSGTPSLNDFPYTGAGGWPVMSRAAATLLGAAAHILPVVVEAGTQEDHGYCLVQARHVLDALDPLRSQFGENPYLPEAPPYPKTPFLRRDLDYPEVFRVQSFLVPLFVNPTTAEAMRRRGMEGFLFHVPDGPL